MTLHKYPHNLLWGAATAFYQIEGVHVNLYECAESVKHHPTAHHQFLAAAD